MFQLIKIKIKQNYIIKEKKEISENNGNLSGIFG